ncbi:MAG: hypothetical protein GTO62_15280, partial [Planctomycetales bacterium]|nr:hypothetical protein [Planctomycetales bacterium]
MGNLHFLVPRREALSSTAVERAYVTGLDAVPWISRIEATPDGLVVDRSVTDSGNFHIPWRVDGYGEIVLTTGSLMERSQPYLLEVELARGTLNRIRNQLDIWEQAGMKIPTAITDRLGQAIDRFAQAATSQNHPIEACQLAAEVIATGVQITVDLAASYAEQALKIRHQSAPKLLTLLGASLGHEPLTSAQAQIFLGAFNAGLVPLPWGQIEAVEGKQNWSLTDTQVDWCQHHGLKICSEPLIQFDGSEVPDWLYLWEDDVENVMSFVSDYVRRVVERYQGRFQIWQCAARINTGNFLGISLQNKIRMVLRIVELARQLDPRTPVVITLDQPWGEYVSRQEADLPLHLADTLLRSGLEVSGVGLE